MIYNEKLGKGKTYEIPIELWDNIKSAYKQAKLFDSTKLQERISNQIIKENSYMRQLLVKCLNSEHIDVNDIHIENTKSITFRISEDLWVEYKSLIKKLYSFTKMNLQQRTIVVLRKLLKNLREEYINAANKEN